MIITKINVLNYLIISIAHRYTICFTKYLNSIIQITTRFQSSPNKCTRIIQFQYFLRIVKFANLN